MINLDAMSDDDLIKAIRNFNKFIDYANRKRCAIYDRKIGNIELALCHEKILESDYESLDSEYRW